MKAIIVDDDQVALHSLDFLCKKIPGLEVAAIFDNAIDAIAYLKKNTVDILFLDIEMPDFSGLELVESISNLPQVIFTTAKAEYAIQAFEHDVTDYIQKPVTLPRLQKAVERVEKQLKDQNKSGQEYIFIKSNGKLVKLMLKEIQYIESIGDYVAFVMDKNQKYVVHGTIKAMIEKLDLPDFVKVHRAFIVNISKINNIEDTAITIGDRAIPVSRAHKSLLMERIKPL
ncbi:MAG: LytR/AlgR family response regulator transcription factor [Flavobacteriales bacterium]